jgi:hypothetical protein
MRSDWTPSLVEVDQETPILAIHAARQQWLQNVETQRVAGFLGVRTIGRLPGH